MSRRTMILALALAAVAAPRAGRGQGAGFDPHVDPGLLVAGCAGCHEGHGASRSPMLPAAQKVVCLRCHDSRSGLSQQVSAGAVAPGASPPLLSAALSQPNVHPVSDGAFSSREPGEVTCTSCHSPHRAMAPGATSASTPGRQRLSPKNPDRFEFELCLSCHGSVGGMAANLLDISRLTDPNNRSFHPVEAPALERAPSVVDYYAGREINCTDCHGNSDRGGPQGPHGSAVPGLLRAEYVTTDGSPESAATYALCYRCHDREAVFANPSFLLHADHALEERASCATCHDPHGSVDNRALIRFGEQTLTAGVGPSGSGRLAFVSTGPGSGSCYLTCHGRDHDPEAYGLAELSLEAAREGLALPGLGSPEPPPRPPPLPRRPEPRRRPPP